MLAGFLSFAAKWPPVPAAGFIGAIHATGSDIILVVRARSCFVTTSKRHPSNAHPVRIIPAIRAAVVCISSGEINSRDPCNLLE